MSEFQATTVLLLMFALRCLAPLLLTVLIGRWMNQKVARWEARDRARQAGVTPRPGMALPPAAQAPSRPCFSVRDCSPARRVACPAYQRRGVACWQARAEAEGALPAGCPTCPLYALAAAGD